jgi:hypothetical protein
LDSSPDWLVSKGRLKVRPVEIRWRVIGYKLDINYRAGRLVVIKQNAENRLTSVRSWHQYALAAAVTRPLLARA